MMIRPSPSSSEGSKQSGARKLNLGAFLDRLTTRVDQIRELDVFRVFSATKVHDTADQLLARRAANLNIRIECRAEVRRERHGHIRAVQCDTKSRDRKPVQQRAACR